MKDLPLGLCIELYYLTMTGLDELVNSNIRMICGLLIILQIICCHFPAQPDILSPVVERMNGIGLFAGVFNFGIMNMRMLTERNINLEMIRCHVLCLI